MGPVRNGVEACGWIVAGVMVIYLGQVLIGPVLEWRRWRERKRWRRRTNVGWKYEEGDPEPRVKEDEGEMRRRSRGEAWREPGERDVEG
jgi:hypothetical protein